MIKVNTKNYINLNKKSYSKKQLKVLNAITQKQVIKEEFDLLMNSNFNEKQLTATRFLLDKNIDIKKLELLANPKFSPKKINLLKLILSRKVEDSTFLIFVESNVSDEQMLIVRERIYLRNESKITDELLKILLSQEIDEKSLFLIRDLYFNDVKAKDIESILSQNTNYLQLRQIKFLVDSNMPIDVIVQLSHLNWQVLAQLRLYYLDGASIENILDIKNKSWEEIYIYRNK